jgi:hypothetical protein
MQRISPLQRPAIGFISAVILPAMFSAAHSEVNTGFAYSSGPDGYRSRELSVSTDLPRLPVVFEAKEFVAHGASGQIMNEQTFGLIWNVSDRFSVGYRHQNGHGDLMNVLSQELSTSFDFASLISQKNPTRFDIHYTETTYDPNASDPVAKAAIKAMLPEVKQYTLGIHQGMGDNWDFSLSYDDYQYSKDPVDVARQMLRRVKRPNNGIFEIIGFPDRSTSAGVTWKPIAPLSLDLSFRSTTSVLNQSQDNVRLGMNYQFNRNYQLGTSISRATTSEIRSNAGALIAESSGANYFEISASLNFD